MNARILVAGLAMLAAIGGARAGEMRTWTDCQGKTIEAKTEGFEQATTKLSRKSGALIVDGVRYSQLGPAMKKALGLMLRRHGFDDIDAAVPRDSTATKEFGYTVVILRTKDERVLRAPLDSLDGAENDTGDYRIALDESKSWLNDAKKPKGPANVNAQRRLALDEQRRREEAERLARQRTENERKNAEAERKRAESYKDREKRLRHSEDDLRRRQERLDREHKDQQAKADELRRREQAIKDAQRKERQRLEKEKQELAKKQHAAKDQPKKQDWQKERAQKQLAQQQQQAQKDREKKERERKEQEKKQQDQRRNKKH